MKKVNTFGIQFVIRKHRIKEGKAPIYARVTVNSSRCEISVKRRKNRFIGFDESEKTLMELIDFHNIHLKKSHEPHFPVRNQPLAAIYRRG